MGHTGHSVTCGHGDTTEAVDGCCVVGGGRQGGNVTASIAKRHLVKLGLLWVGR